MKLVDQVALVTGASRGLGLAIAKVLAAEGASIACVARAGSELDRAVGGLSATGARALAVPADVTSDAAVEAAVRTTLERLGKIDLLVLNAGTWQGAPLHETSEAMWDQLIDLNLKGAFLTLRHALPAMLEAGRGTIVGIDSIGGWVGLKNSAAYAASKWGLRGLLESVALEVKPRRIRVSIVSPHNMNTAGKTFAPGSAERDQNIEPEDVAAVVVHVCAAPDHVAIGNVTVWPLAARIESKT